MRALPTAPERQAEGAGALAPHRQRNRHLLAAGGVAAGFVLLQLLLSVPGTGLGWDETIYLSQFGGEAPAAYFSAPRARGITYLVAPVDALTSSVTALRAGLALVSGAGVLLALWAWRRLLTPAVLAWAGGLFCTLWITLFYGPQAMPNLWCALGALAATGCFLRTAAPDGRPEPRALTGLGLSVAFVALMRPMDGLWLVLALGGIALCVRRFRSLAVLAVLAGTAAAGAAPWVAEAFTHYGGLSARLDRSSEIQGGLAWHPAFGEQMRSLQGRVLCRPCSIPWDKPLTALWWFALPLLTGAGLVAARRSGRLRPAVIATVVGCCAAVPYLLFTPFAAPRFLLPAYALLSVPVAEGIVRALGRGADGRRRPLFAAGVAALLAGHLVVQYQVLDYVTGRNHQQTSRAAVAAQILHRQGVRPPCNVTGNNAVPIAYYAGCASRYADGPDRSTDAAGLRSLVQRTPSAVLVRDGAPVPRVARDWPEVRLPGWGQTARISPAADRP